MAGRHRDNLPKPTVSYRQRWIIQLSGPEYPLSGHTGNNDKAIVFDGKIVDCALFALWIRGLIPSNVELLMWDDKGDEPFALNCDTSAEEIVKFFESTT